MPTVNRSGMGPIILAVRNRLAAENVMPLQAIKIWARGHRECPALQTKRDILLRPGPLQPYPGWQEGSGRVATGIIRSLDVVARISLAVDSSDTDKARYASALGLEDLTDDIADVLCEPWFPSDNDGNHLTIEPLLLLPSSAPSDDPSDVTWAYDTVTFRVSYMLPLRQD